METTTAQKTASDRNAATMRRFYSELFIGRRFELMSELVSPELINHTAPAGHQHGFGPITALIKALGTAFPDGSYDIEDVVTDGDVAVMRAWYQGTHLGDFFGHTATGRPFRFLQIHWMRFGGDGRIIEHWGLRDDATHLRQLGVTG
ncbi:MAG TPA: ester cyclase [Acidimicrobiales bacterium]|jgi:predicted ester cyclase